MTDKRITNTLCGLLCLVVAVAGVLLLRWGVA
jgi:hypothetical protein